MSFSAIGSGGDAGASCWLPRLRIVSSRSPLRCRPNLAFDASTATGYHRLLGSDSNSSPSGAVFYMFSQLVLNMFLIELCVGVLSSTYAMLKERAQGTALLTAQQKLWLSNLQTVLAAQPKALMQPPVAPAGIPCWLAVRRAAFRFCEWPTFSHSVYVAICLNAVAMAAHHYPSSLAFAAAGESDA